MHEMTPEILHQALELLESAGLAVRRDGRWFLHPSVQATDGDELDDVLAQVTAGRMTLEEASARLLKPGGLPN